MKSIMILMTDSGGGHRASAEALRDAFEERCGDQVHIDLVDLWMDHTPPPINRMPKGYRFLVDDVPWLYKRLYELTERPQIIDTIMKTAVRLLQSFVAKAIRRFDPDLIISVHPLIQEVPLRVLARMKRDIPFVTVVTDLVTVPPVWFNKSATLCFVPSEEAFQLGLRAGMRVDQLRQHGLPIRPAFARARGDRTDLRRRLGMDVNLPAALFVSGGEGMGPVADIARSVVARLALDHPQGRAPAGQLVVVCGRNQKLHEELTDERWPVPTCVLSFVDNMWDWMAASDCIITKAGPGTIAEALAVGLPILLSGYIHGQETGNVPYVLKHLAGVYAEDPVQIAEIVSGWFGGQRASLDLHADRARALGHPQATFKIVEDAAALIGLDCTGYLPSKAPEDAS